jgi:hypothetical protein
MTALDEARALVGGDGPAAERVAAVVAELRVRLAEAEKDRDAFARRYRDVCVWRERAERQRDEYVRLFNERDGVLERIERALGDACTGHLAADVERLVERHAWADERRLRAEKDAGALRAALTRLHEAARPYYDVSVNADERARRLSSALILSAEHAAHEREAPAQETTGLSRDEVRALLAEGRECRREIDARIARMERWPASANEKARAQQPRAELGETCPCEGDDEEPGPHIATCPLAQPARGDEELPDMSDEPYPAGETDAGEGE